jgi:hypothetical protein
MSRWRRREWRDSSSTMTLAAAAMRATRSGPARRISTVPGATSRAVMCWRARTGLSRSASGVRMQVVVAASSATVALSGQPAAGNHGRRRPRCGRPRDDAIDCHLRKVFTKLGITSRTELARG